MRRPNSGSTSPKLHNNRSRTPPPPPSLTSGPSTTASPSPTLSSRAPAPSARPERPPSLLRWAAPSRHPRELPGRKCRSRPQPRADLMASAAASVGLAPPVAFCRSWLAPPSSLRDVPRRTNLVSSSPTELLPIAKYPAWRRLASGSITPSTTRSDVGKPAGTHIDDFDFVAEHTERVAAHQEVGTQSNDEALVGRGEARQIARPEPQTQAREITIQLA